MKTLADALWSRVFGFFTVQEFAIVRLVSSQWSKARAAWRTLSFSSVGWLNVAQLALCSAVRAIYLKDYWVFDISDIPKLFQKVKFVSLKNTSRTHDKLAVLTQVQSVASLQVAWCSHLSAVDFQRVATMTWLLELEFFHVDLRDDGLRTLSMMKDLKLLYLIGCQFSENQLKHLGLLTNLTDLDLSETKVTDADMSELKTLVNLTDFRASGTEIGDESVFVLNKLSKLTHLDFAHCVKITGQGVLSLRDLPNLKEVILTGTAVPNLAVHELCMQSTLKPLNVDASSIILSDSSLYPYVSARTAFD